MSKPFIPRRDADFGNFATAMAATLATQYMAYDVTAGEAAGLTSLVNTYSEALARVADHSTRTSAAVEAKNQSKGALLITLRFMAQNIKRNRGISNEAKIALGINIDDLTPTRIPAPPTAPLIYIMGATPLRHTLRFADSATPDRRAKPWYARQLLLLCHVGTHAPESPYQAILKALITRQPYDIHHDACDKCKNAYYYAAWVGTRGQIGPLSSVASMTIAG